MLTRSESRVPRTMRGEKVEIYASRNNFECSHDYLPSRGSQQEKHSRCAGALSLQDIAGYWYILQYPEPLVSGPDLCCSRRPPQLSTSPSHSHYIQHKMLGVLSSVSSRLTRPTLALVALHSAFPRSYHTTVLTAAQQSCRRRVRLEKVPEFRSLPKKNRACFFAACAAVADDAPESPKPPEEWDLAGFKRVVRRQADRAMKKVAKATTKLRNAREATVALTHDEDASLKDLEKCPDVVVMEADLEGLRARALALNSLYEALREVKSNGDQTFPDIVANAILLDVNDALPLKAPRGAKKPKGKPATPRSPYFTYTSADGVEIRVGRRAEDNDELSCNPEHRDNADWWMHAVGCPGSHVVIRFTEQDVPRETLVDAAVLSVKNSKAPYGGKSSASLVRCRQVSKPKGAKAGLVQLSGDVKSITINLNNETERLLRLEATKR